MRRRHKQGALSTNGMRSMWEFVFVSQFLRVFQGKFGFVCFTAEELENAFLESENSTLFGIFIQLLRTLLPKRDVKQNTWQEVLEVELERRSSDRSLFDEGKRYVDLKPEDRVLLLKQLIYYLADHLAASKDEQLKEFTKNFLNPDSSGVKPIGRDASNNIYWYFDDLRLYRELIGKKGRRTGWETVCLNCQDWEKLLSSFQKSSNSNEKKLYKYLKNELYPAVMPSVKEDEKEKELETLKKDRSSKANQKAAAKQKADNDAVVGKEGKLERIKGNKPEEDDDLGAQEDQEEQEDDTAEEDQDEDDVSDAERELELDEEDSPRPRKKRKRPAPEQGTQRRRGRPPATKRDLGIMDENKPMERAERRRKKSELEEKVEKDMEERKELERRVEEEIQKQESFISAAGVDSRTKRRCVIMREQMNKKKEWWEEEGLGSESEEDNEKDIDSDGSEGPRRRRKQKVLRPVEIPEPPNRIYVFSTSLANRAAEAVQMGRVENITAYHRAQPSSSPFLKLEQTNSMNMFGKQKSFYPQQFPMRGSGGPVMSGYSGIPGSQVNARPGYGASQWEHMQQQSQQPLYKDRQRLQTQTQAMEDIHQLLFGNSQSSSNQSTVTGMNGMYSRSGFNQQGALGGEQSPYSGYPRSGAPQHQGSFMERRPQEMRGQVQQSHFPAFSQQQSSQQQGYFQRPRHLGGIQTQGNSNSPSSDPLGAGVRSPPPPYPGGRVPDSRHPKNSPVPSPTSTGSPHTPQTPLTPQTPRFPGPSPNEPSKPPFSPSHPQSSMSGPGMASYPVQPQQHQKVVQGDDRPINSQTRPGFIELSPKTLPHGMQNPYTSVMGNYNQSHSPLDGRRLEENKSPAFGAPGNHHSPLHSPTEHAPTAGSHYSSAPPNKSPFLRPVGQTSHNPHSPYATSSSVSIPGSKSFSVESLTAPSQPPLDKSTIPPSQLSEQPMPQYSGLYFPSNKYPPMFGQPQYQYPSHIQHPGAFYNSQLTPNMYLGRASLPVYPPNRDSGL
ncbi:serine/arginine repetitive matrix protein 1-like [Pocillopora damicornis]|uniref:serine/arginine repetitive matrix protein 1-like n=1 Tax=Pocillopora damicornis TaxID=46731 RepID=UPI000F54FB7F|nr:serine/arginine repetitive matrix protein 1-like [Pocillopora damicornis]